MAKISESRRKSVQRTLCLFSNVINISCFLVGRIDTVSIEIIFKKIWSVKRCIESNYYYYYIAAKQLVFC